jgi:hypothetical protein
MIPRKRIHGDGTLQSDSSVTAFPSMVVGDGYTPTVQHPAGRG